MRTCIGCRRTDSRLSLLRIVRETASTDGTSAVADPLRRLPGRGAWLHPTEECLALALKKRAIGRALAGAADSADVQAYIARLSQAQAAVHEP
ncbi:YlxR family protein [Pseudarthrobacter sp. P1]|uniref:YlxR family protein n=1 Tax=Pseudarthrobacter sp. P1 TaxID=3418418 RepID=UPI003CF74ACC